MSLLPRKTYEMPFLLSVALGCATLACVFTLWAALLGLVGRGDFKFNGQPADPARVMRYVWVLLPPGLLAGPVAYGIRRERSWSRYAILLWWVAYGALFIGFNLVVNTAQAAIEPTVNTLLGLGFSWWYLYRKANVVAYYDALETREMINGHEANVAGG